VDQLSVFVCDFGPHNSTRDTHHVVSTVAAHCLSSDDLARDVDAYILEFMTPYGLTPDEPLRTVTLLMLTDDVTSWTMCDWCWQRWQRRIRLH